MMQKELLSHMDKVRFFLGDVRDKCRLIRALKGVDYVVHAAALKQVPALEYNPMEAVKTNVIGAENLVDAAIESGVKKVVALSTDKAVNPINLYGATKLVAEKIFVAANAYAGGKAVFAAVRYGNVMGSRGSVIPFFMDLQRQGIREFPITDDRMTRFWLTLDEGVGMVFTALKEAAGGEIFIPKIPSMRITELAKAIDPECQYRITGIRAGEKLHETLISEDEARNARYFDGMYVIIPQFVGGERAAEKYARFSSLPEGFVYRSDVNDTWMNRDQLRDIIQRLDIE
jgi:UDP-N-acetylglucosamine 4,6-dehydratase